MKIVIDARELRTSSGRYVERLLHYLQIIDKVNEYVVLIKPIDFDGWNPTNPNFTKEECPVKEFTFAEQVGLGRQIRKTKADLVHFPFPQQPVLYRGKTVTTFHDLTTLRFTNPDKNLVVFRLKQKIFEWVMKRAASKSEDLIVPSEFVKKELVGFFGVKEQKINVIYEASEAINQALEPLPELLNKQFIMYVGRPTPHKNLERLIDAFALLKSQHPQLQLVLAGKEDANYRRVRESAAKRGVGGIVFTDFVSEGQLRWLYETCEAYVFPSLSEGFGLPGLEAMMHGAPVVSSNATCLPEIYGEAAHYFDPTDVQAISDAISEVLTDKNLRQKLIIAGKEQAKKYSWQTMAEKTLKLYNQILQGNKVS